MYFRKNTNLKYEIVKVHNNLQNYLLHNPFHDFTIFLSYIVIVILLYRISLSLHDLLIQIFIIQQATNIIN